MSAIHETRAMAAGACAVEQLVEKVLMWMDSQLALLQ
jgi:hypothetical protein